MAISYPVILVATHHKTGTVWMSELFRRIAERLGTVFRRLRDFEPLPSLPAGGGADGIPGLILLQDHARLHETVHGMEGLRGWHVVRDPRDVTISAANYHGWAAEKWLAEPRTRLAGKSYQQALRPLGFADALCFEWDGSSGQTIRDMTGFCPPSDRFVQLHHEALLGDPDGAAVCGYFRFLGFSGDGLDVAMQVYCQLHVRAKGSPFADAQAVPALRTHVQNPDIAQWRYLFDPSLLARFAARFPGAATGLGYPPDDPALLLDDPARRGAYVARFLANRERYGEALAVLDDALERCPQSALLRSVRGQILKGRTGSDIHEAR